MYIGFIIIEGRRGRLRKEIGVCRHIVTGLDAIVHTFLEDLSIHIKL